MWAYLVVYMVLVVNVFWWCLWDVCLWRLFRLGSMGSVSILQCSGGDAWSAVHSCSETYCCAWIGHTVVLLCCWYVVRSIVIFSAAAGELLSCCALLCVVCVWFFLSCDGIYMLWVAGLRLRVAGWWRVKVWWFGFEGLGLRVLFVEGWVLSVEGWGVRVWGSGFRV